MTMLIENYALAAKEVVNLVGKNIVIGVPLGLGKPIGLLNALYQLACLDSSIRLTIITGLTLARPSLKNELEKKFIEPILDRILKDHEDPLYEKQRELQLLPPNIKVIEFFLSPGKFLNNTYAQSNYISSTYTNAVRDTINLSINVLAQLISSPKHHPDVLSLSCNTDLFHDMHQQLKKLEKNGKKIAIIGEVNANLPYMYGEVAEINRNIFSFVVDTKKYQALFAMPREELSVQDHLIGLYSSSLIKDNGCLQIGIGKLSNALANALIFRHKNNELYRNLLKNLGCGDTDALKVFDKGLYASTEMLSDEYMQLYNQGILKKRVYDHVGLQALLNEEKISEKILPNIINVLIERGVINKVLTSVDVDFLKKFGILKQDFAFDNLSFDKSNIEKYLGDKLILGKILHAGFFFGSIDLYAQLKNMSYEELQLFEMTSILRTNSLRWSPQLLILQRINARFINSTLMVTLLGGAISDGLTNYQEVSGVGGQFDFVNMGNQLDDALSIINCRSTRETKSGVVSNIVWDYSNSTLPRFLRDLIVTEYGIADCRSKTDSEIIKAILNIADSRFQQGLLNSAIKAGKISSDYQIPLKYRNNYPDQINQTMHEMTQQGHFKPYPFGSDLTSVEEKLAQVLLYLKNQSKFKLFYLILISLFYYRSDINTAACIQRMSFNHPKTPKTFIYKKLLQYLCKNTM